MGDLCHGVLDVEFLLSRRCLLLFLDRPYMRSGLERRLVVDEQ